MRSRLGVAGSATVLLSLPLAVAYGVFFGAGERIIHFGVGAGFVMLAVGLFDFGLGRWVTWLGAGAAAAFGGIFLLQGVAEMVGDEGLWQLAFQVLGQGIERVLPDVLFVWFLALLLTGSSGRSRWLGWVITPLVIGLEVAIGIGMIVGIDVPFIKLMLFLPLVWLLVESAKAASPDSASSTAPRHSAMENTATAA